MSAPDRPTREQVEAALADADRAPRVMAPEDVYPHDGTRFGRGRWNPLGILAAEVRALLAELELFAMHPATNTVKRLLKAEDELSQLRAAEVARTPQPAGPRRTSVCTCSGTEDPPLPSEMDPACPLHGLAPQPAEPCERCAHCVVPGCPDCLPSPTARADLAGLPSPLPAVPDGEDEPDWHNMRERLHTEIGAIVGVTPREERTGDADGDLIEMVRRAVWAPSPATASDGDDLPARLDAAADALVLSAPWFVPALRELARDFRSGAVPAEVRAAVAAALALPATGGEK